MSLNNNLVFENNKYVRKLLNFIANKEYVINDKLPTERELAKQLQISRNSLREALKILQTIEVIEIRKSSGIYVKRSDLDPKTNAPRWLFVNKEKLMDILAVRETLDFKAIDLIPERLYPIIYKELLQSIEKIKKNLHFTDALLDHDLEFHNIIRNASGNELLLNICSALTGGIYDERRALYTLPDHVKQSLNDHQRIAEAFKKENIDEIKGSYLEHVKNTRRRIQNP